MPEDRDRPTSFAEAQATTRMGEIEDVSTIASWMDSYQDKLQDAADAAAEQTEDKGFWGNAVTIGATVGCMALDLATGGVCTIAGLVLGSGARMLSDESNDAEEMVPGKAVGPDVDYYRNKIPGLVDDLNSSKEKLDSFHANEWKRDVLIQLNDTMTAVQLGSKMSNLGIFSPDDAAGDAGDIVSILSGDETDALSIFESDLFIEPPTFTA